MFGGEAPPPSLIAYTLVGIFEVQSEISNPDAEILQNLYSKREHDRSLLYFRSRPSWNCWE